MRVFLCSLLLGATLTIATTSLVQSAIQPGYGCVVLPLDREFATSRTVILVRVLKSTYTSDPGANFLSNATATLIVERYWKGPFMLGDSIKTATQTPCIGLCAPYPFQVDQRALIFTAEVNDPLHTTICSVVSGETVKDTMGALDDLLRETPGPN
jgi:hypothetical protein